MHISSIWRRCHIYFTTITEHEIGLYRAVFRYTLYFATPPNIEKNPCITTILHKQKHTCIRINLEIGASANV